MAAMTPADAVMLIPSLEPDDRLPHYVERLKAAGFCHIVVIDDGSSAPFQPIFEKIDAMEGCQVLHHPVNKGKGVALKTGYKWIMENLPDCSGVITADADGQHTVEDCMHLAQELCKGKRALYLGSRDFDLPDVPERSKKGNHITSAVFKLLYGQYLPDTQTGLRAFLRQDLQFMTDVEGERYEYEMKVLIACARARIPMIPITIETVYENDNAGSHFHPIRDSWRIYKVLLGSFFKFMGVSLLSWVVDQGFAAILGDWLLPLCGVAAGSAALAFVSGYGARIISAIFNFSLNRKMVFKDQGSVFGSAWRYALLAIVIITVSNACVWLLGKLGLARWIAKMVIDLILYVASYRVQNLWVFKGDKKK